MAEDELIKKHTKAAYNVWKDPEKHWVHKLKEIGLEILIIVFAVTVSIWFHNWSEDLKDRAYEKEFLNGLKGDINADVEEMKNDRSTFKKQLLGVHYFESVGRGQELTKDSLNKHFWIFFAQTQINPRIGRYEALKGSGKLDIIENKKLQYDIIELYQKDFPYISRANQNTDLLISNKIDNFIEDNVNLDEKGSLQNPQGAFRKPKMRLLLLQYEGVKNNIEAYTVGIDKAKEIVKEIDEELK